MFDKKYISEVVAKIKDGSLIFQNLSIVEQVNDEIAKVGLEKDGLNLRYLSQKQQNDKELVYLAIKSNPNAYFYTSMLLQRDEEIAWLTLKHDCSNDLLIKISNIFYKKNKEITKYIIQKSSYVYEYHKYNQFPPISEILKDQNKKGF